VRYSWDDSQQATIVAPHKNPEENKDATIVYREGINAVLPDEIWCLILKEAASVSPFLMNNLLSFVCKLWRDLLLPRNDRPNPPRLVKKLREWDGCMCCSG